VAFKGEILPGEQPTILNQQMFEAAQRKPLHFEPS
jgi:hypothetical protein